MTARIVTQPAKRGDLIAVLRQQRTHGAAGASTEDQIDVGVVTNIYRDGMVKAFRQVGWNAIRPLEHVVGYVQHWVMPATSIDVGAAVEIAAAHTYPNSTQTMPFASLDELRAAIRPCLLNTSTGVTA
ncbi:hypothetical protein CLV30_12556 [Haloactinopolyspora alba]|uniref:Uncharacterized protein n=1 Tax=Haloactinopolyspora alba TaxID=648780 RepID=A0A2P8DHH3_9ACTN|nr:hypothetical protein [Haloactinopolyspora alba]PSK96674.1 hypothetical protein CLV30_12556 [Haloactinopolyspora alba]